MDGRMFLEDSVPYKLVDANGIGKYLAVKADSTGGQNDVTIAGAATDRILGVSAQQYDAAGDIEVLEGSVIPMVSSAAINRFTGGKPTRVVGAANGRVAALGSTVGTHEVFGEVHASSPAATDAGQIVWIKVQRQVVVIAPGDTGTAADIAYVPAEGGGLEAETVQDAIEELDGDKVAVVADAVEDNFASFDDAGGIKDSGAAAADFAAADHDHDEEYAAATHAATHATGQSDALAPGDIGAIANPADGAEGDILYHNGTSYVRLPKGTDGQVLTLAGGVPTWAGS